MFGKQLIAAMAALIFIPAATMALGERADSVAPDYRFSGNPIYGAQEKASAVLAQNDARTPEESEKAEPGSETGASDAAAGDDKISSAAESKPLTPFVPSEKIPGDQAVDFPVDI